MVTVNIYILLLTRISAITQIFGAGAPLTSGLNILVSKSIGKRQAYLAAFPAGIDAKIQILVFDRSRKTIQEENILNIQA